MRLRLLSIVLAAAQLAACAGGTATDSASFGPGMRVKPLAATRRVPAVIRIRIPKHRRLHRARYVAPTTKGLTVALSGPTTIDETVGLTPSSPNCTADAQGIFCLVPLSLGACPSSANCYNGSISTYDDVACAGGTCVIPLGANELSANQSVAFSVSIGKSNVVQFVLDGLPASATIVSLAASTLSGTASSGFTISKCVTVPQQVDVAGVDADGNQIVGLGSPAVSLTSDDPANLAVATPSPSSPNTFSLVPPSTLASATIPRPETVVHLTASVTPPAGSGGSERSAQVDVTFNGDVCGIITEFTIPTPVSLPYGIATGPDGALWFTERCASKIGRVTTNGVFDEYPLGAAAYPENIVAGPDGAMWFAENGGNAIGRITTLGSITTTGVPVSNSQPEGIAVGPDGAFWFSEYNGGNIGRITTAAVVTNEFGPTGSEPSGIAAGPDGALWFAEYGQSAIGRVTTGGNVSGVTLASGLGPRQITAGPDGAMWFTEELGDAVGRITTGDTITETSTPTSGSAPFGIDEGPDGALWFTEEFVNKIGRITTDGTITNEYPLPNAHSNPFGITTGPDGALWFVEFCGNRVGRMQ